MTGHPAPPESSWLGDAPRARVDPRAGWVVVAVFALLTGVTLWAYWDIERELDRTLEQKLSAVLVTSERAATKWLLEQELLVSKLARDPGLTLALEQPDDELRRAAIERALSPLTHAGLIAHYAVFDVDGLLLAPSTGPARPPIAEATWQILRRQGVVVHLASADARAGWAGHLTAWARLGEDARPLGYVALCVTPDDPASGLALASWGDTGRTFAFDAQGHVLAASATPGRPAPPLAPRPELAQAARSSGSIWLDAEGTRLGPTEIGGAIWLPGPQLGVAVAIERGEAYESVAVLRRTFLVLVVLIVGALFAFLALGRWSMRVHDASVLVTQRLGRLARTIQPLSAALEHDPGAIVLVDELGAIVYANASARTILGVDTPLIGKAAHEVFEHLHSELRDAVVSGVEAIVAHRPGSDDETLLVTSRPLRIEGKPHVMYSLRPVTREVRRQEVEHWKKLIRVLSHELNNTLAPITSLVSSARTLNDQHFHDAKLGKILDAITERTTHLVSFLESYRSLARLPRPSPRPVDWETFLEGVRLQRAFAIRGALPTEPGYFDPIQLERVLINALDNAVEAGSLLSDVEVSVSASDDGALLEILDRGSGMTEPVLRQAMLPFFSTKASGTGVGLALSREIVEAHGGQMTLANREGGGLVVSVFLPLARPPALSERSFPSLPELRSVDSRPGDSRTLPIEPRPLDSRASDSRASEGPFPGLRPEGGITITEPPIAPAPGPSPGESGPAASPGATGAIGSSGPNHGPGEGGGPPSGPPRR